MNDALILVDLQNDFLPGGALAVPKGDQVLDVANRMAAQFERTIATQDWHPANHKSFASQHPGTSVGDVTELAGLPQVLWPDHCVQQSLGAEFASNLQLPETAKIIQKGTNVEIDSYSGFYDNGQRHSTGLDEFLKREEVKRVYVMGLATDYCVKFTVLDALRLGFETNLVLDGCRGVDLNKGDVEQAVADMKSAGAVVMSSREIHQSPNQRRT